MAVALVETNLADHILTRFEPVLQDGLVISAGASKIHPGQVGVLLIDPNFAPDMQPIKRINIGSENRPHYVDDFRPIPVGDSILKCGRGPSIGIALVNLLKGCMPNQPINEKLLIPYQLVEILQEFDSVLSGRSSKLWWEQGAGMVVSRHSPHILTDFLGERLIMSAKDVGTRVHGSLIEAVSDVASVSVFDRALIPPEDFEYQPIFIPRVKPHWEEVASNVISWRSAHPSTRGLARENQIVREHPELGSNFDEVLRAAFDKYPTISGVMKFLRTSYNFTKPRLEERGYLDVPQQDLAEA